jgi:hypothetical protein
LWKIILRTKSTRKKPAMPSNKQNLSFEGMENSLDMIDLFFIMFFFQAMLICFCFVFTC